MNLPGQTKSGGNEMYPVLLELFCMCGDIPCMTKMSGVNLNNDIHSHYTRSPMDTPICNRECENIAVIPCHNRGYIAKECYLIDVGLTAFLRITSNYRSTSSKT